MKSDIRVCSDWEAAHERPVYALGEECPDCGAETVNSAPARFNPEDPYGEYRRRARRRAADGAVADDVPADSGPDDGGSDLDDGNSDPDDGNSGPDDGGPDPDDGSA